MYHIPYIHVYNMDVKRRMASQINKHQQRTEATRRKLLNSAFRIFVRDGFEAARLEDIAAHAGYTRGAFYANFKSKEDLFFALLEEQVREHVSNVQRLFDECPDEQDRLATLREYYVKRVADRKWVLLMIEFKLYAVHHSRARAKLVETHRRIRAQSVLKLEQMLPAKSDSLRASLEGALNGLVLEQAYDPKRVSLPDAGTLLGRIFDALLEST